jgi:hypothetical protein
MAAGEAIHELRLDNQDELAQVVGAFNRVAAALVSDIAERKRAEGEIADYLRQVATVTAAAAALEAGAYEASTLAEVRERDDPLGRLARVFDGMARQLRSREESLQQQVTELRIEIDEARLARDLAAITKADYFEEVRRRGQLMREFKAQQAALAG